VTSAQERPAIPEGEPAESVQQLMQAYQDKLTGGLYESIYRLDAASLDALMQGQARTCATAFIDLTGLSTPMDLDTFLDEIRTAGPSQLETQREGDVIHWTELHRGECVCPLVRRRVIRLDQKLCVCGAHWVKELFQRVANTRVDVEAIETVATGADNCRFLITIKRDDD
jgi:hypothetical protein